MTFMHDDHLPSDDNEADWMDDEELIAPMKSLQQFHHSSNYSSNEVEDIDDGIDQETIIDRICALKYIIPYRIRTIVWHTYQFCYLKSARIFSIAGQVSWIFATSLILVGLPIFIEYDREQGIIAFEKEQSLQQGSEQFI